MTTLLALFTHHYWRLRFVNWCIYIALFNLVVCIISNVDLSVMSTLRSSGIAEVGPYLIEGVYLTAVKWSGWPCSDNAGVCGYLWKKCHIGAYWHSSNASVSRWLQWKWPYRQWGKTGCDVMHEDENVRSCMQTADTWASNDSLESRMTSRVVTWSVAVRWKM